MHLKEIAYHVAPGAHAVLLLDQAGWHGSAELIVPNNITLMPLPPRCPELNPVENVWQFMRDRYQWEEVIVGDVEPGGGRCGDDHTISHTKLG